MNALVSMLVRTVGMPKETWLATDCCRREFEFEAPASSGWIAYLCLLKKVVWKEMNLMTAGDVLSSLVFLSREVICRWNAKASSETPVKGVRANVTRLGNRSPNPRGDAYAIRVSTAECETGTPMRGDEICGLRK
ncbi:hypothetical protein MTO96_010939 [Rhipicephalus appendiculatus]